MKKDSTKIDTEFKYEFGEDGKLKYKFKSDILFKMLFTENAGLLKSPVAASLGVSKSRVGKIRIKNPEIIPEEVEKKYCRLDLNLEVGGEQVGLEVQLADEYNYRDRAAYYLSKLHVSGLNAGEDYAETQKSTLVSFVDFKMFDSEDIISEFGFYEKKRHELLTDKVNLIFYELKKLPKEINEKDSLQVWLKVLNAETKDDIEELEHIKLKEVEQVMKAYKTITAEERYRELERQREKREHDETSIINYAEKRGEKRGVAIGEKRKDEQYYKAMQKSGLNDEQIALVKANLS